MYLFLLKIVMVMINWYNRTLCHPIQSVIILMINETLTPLHFITMLYNINVAL